MSALGKGISTGLIIGLLGALFSLTPLGLWLEEDIGLYWLFHKRGKLTEPQHVAVVSIDKASTDSLKLPRLPRKWSRDIHGELLARLQQVGAKVVAFDFKFVEPRDAAGDAAFARAIGEFGNVVLFEQIQREVIDAGGAKIFKERRLPPIDIFTQRAAATAPFPLPKVPVKVSQFWAFKTSMGEVPTMPVVGLQTALWKYNESLDQLIAKYHPQWQKEPTAISRQNLYARAERMRRLFSRAGPWLSKLRADVGRQFPQDVSQQILILLNIYAGPNSYYLNLYGPPRSIQTLSYAEVLDKDNRVAEILRDRFVFVGFAEQLQPEQTDYFHTVFSRRDGVDISGVEITATALANFLDQNLIRIPPVGWQFLLLTAWAVLLGMVVRTLGTTGVLLSHTLLAVVYFLLANYQFQVNYQWWPVFIPLMLQMPLILLVGFVLRHRDVNRERQLMQKAFGYYLPDHMVDTLAKGASISGHSDLVYGICLATDAEKYTTLSESLEPSRLREFMNEYYEQLFAPVRRHEGITSDVVGDAILALWASPTDDAGLRQHACLAAREMQQAIQEFNEDNQYGLSLPTRIGVHCGEMMIGNVGALDHYEYRAVGDIVNSTNRIQSLNKLLKTQVLISQEMTRQLDSVPARDLGSFLLKGKTKSIHIFELITDEKKEMRDLLTVFGQALREFEAQRWQTAVEGFEDCLRRFPQDGPSEFYLNIAKKYIQAPPESSWPGAISVVNL